MSDQMKTAEEWGKEFQGMDFNGPRPAVYDCILHLFKEIQNDATISLQRDLAASEAKCERMKALIDRIACSNHPKYVNCEVAWQEIAGTCAAMRDEPRSTSLDLYHKERKKELGEVAEMLKHIQSHGHLNVHSCGCPFDLDSALSILKRLTE